MAVVAWTMSRANARAKYRDCWSRSRNTLRLYSGAQFFLTKKELSVRAKLAYAMLLKYAWQDDACFPGQVTLAEDMGAAERTVRTYLKELETAALLEIEQRGLGKTNLSLSQSDPDVTIV